MIVGCVGELRWGVCVVVGGWSGVNRAEVEWYEVQLVSGVLWWVDDAW